MKICAVRWITFIGQPQQTLFASLAVRAYDEKRKTKSELLNRSIFCATGLPNKPSLQVWPFALMTKNEKQKKGTIEPQQLENYQFLIYLMIQEELYLLHDFSLKLPQSMDHIDSLFLSPLVLKIFCYARNWCYLPSSIYTMSTPF